MLASRFAASTGLKMSSSFSVLCSNGVAVVDVVEVVDVDENEVEVPDAVVVVVVVVLEVDAAVVTTVLGFELWAWQVRSIKVVLVVVCVVAGFGNFRQIR